LAALAVGCSNGGGGGNPVGSVAITQPVAGATLSGDVVVSFDLLPGAGSFAAVDLRIDGRLVAADLQPDQPHSFASGTVLDGPHDLTIVARFSDGSSVESPAVAVTIGNLTTTPSSAVPSPFLATWNGAAAALSAFEGTLDAAWDRQPHSTVHGAQLFTANCHRGAELLTGSALAGNAILLDQYRALGIQGVTIAISYPLLMSDFPGSADYLAFYQALAAEVRARGMYLNVESGVMFGVGGFTTLPVAAYYSGKTLAQHIAGRAAVASTVASALQPDLLLVGAEPDVEALLVGQPVHLLANAVTMYTAITDAVNATAPNLPVGAGVGSWFAAAAQFATAYVAIPNLDVIDVHVYPVDADYLPRASEVAAIARAAGKRIAVTEAWFHKEVGQLVGGGDQWATVSANNVFGFWQPLDQKFLAVLLKWVHHERIDYVAPFWLQTAFAQLPYDGTTSVLTPTQLQNMLATAAATRIVLNFQNPTAMQFTGTGEFYGAMIGWLTNQ